MDLLTAELLRAGMRSMTAARADLWVPPLRTACAEFEIDSPVRLAAFLAQAAHESSELVRLRENLNYSAAALLNTWPTRFTKELAASLAHQPARIAEHVYGDRMGNGPEGSGDAWACRGGGIFQLTGKAAYAAAGKRLGLDLEARPDLITDPLIAARTAGDFWRENGLAALADKGDFAGLTRRINPGLLGMASRRTYFAAFKERLGA